MNTVASRFLSKKKASAYIGEITFAELPDDLKKDVLRFCRANDSTRFIHYGMVVDELIPKVDQWNYSSAKDHIKDEEISKDQICKRIPTKWLILKQDKIVDGTHFLSRAEKAGVTNSLNCLDITPIDFQ